MQERWGEIKKQKNKVKKDKKRKMRIKRIQREAQRKRYREKDLFETATYTAMDVRIFAKQRVTL